MNETLRCLKGRRSVRSYSDKPVPKEILEAIVEAGMYAPTGRNRQNTLFLVITNKELIARISKLNGAVMSSESDPFYGAPAVIVVFADTDRYTYVEDGSVAMANLMNAAYSLGVDSCWIHRAKEVFQSPEGKQIASELGVPEGFVGVGNCILGYRNGPLPTPSPRTQKVIYAD